jgi:hypothetical protein
MKTIEYLRNIDILKQMVKFNYADCDKLFQLNALQYAFENRSFVSVEMITKNMRICKRGITSVYQKIYQLYQKIYHAWM